MKRLLAFAQTCRVCRKSRPIHDFQRPGAQKVTKTCVECLDAKREGREPDVAPAGLSIYLPVVVPPKVRKTRRWWPDWVHAEAPDHGGAPQRNPRGSGDARECAFCGREYEAKNRQQRYCSKRCKGLYAKRKDASTSN